MEGEGRRPALSRAPASFRLRNESLNIVRLRRIFDLFDQNGDGEITPDEISGALDRLGLGADDPTELASAVEAYLRPGHAGLDFDDFQALQRALGDAIFGADKVDDDVEEVDADMAEAFKVFDEDGDGFISAAELHAVLGKLGLPEGRSMARVNEMICSVDRNNDGMVDFVEFKHMMLGISVKTA